MTYFKSLEYLYMGKKTISNYTYIAYKVQNYARWKIIRKNGTDDGDIAYCFGTSDFDTAWASPAGLTYGNP